MINYYKNIPSHNITKTSLSSQKQNSKQQYYNNLLSPSQYKNIHQELQSELPLSLTVNMNSYITSLLNNLTPRIISTTNWKEIFTYIKQTLSLSSTEALLNILILLDRLAEKIHISDFEIKSYYNNIFPELIMHVNSQNEHFKKLSRKVISRLIEQDENIEFLIRFLLVEGIESNDFNLKLNSITVMKMLFECNFSFFLNKPNYSRKIISSLIYHSHDKSDKISNLAISNLKDFISGLPNYNELSKHLSNDILSEIESLTEKEKISNQERMEEIINKTIKKKYMNQVNEDYEIYKSSNNKNNSVFDKLLVLNGFYFGVFPQIIIEGVDTNLDTETRITNFEKLKKIYNENKSNNEFLKYSSTFFDFIVSFIQDSISVIAYNALVIIDDFISYTPGVNLIVNIFSYFGKIIKTLENNNVKIRNQSKDLLYKIMMIIPSSTVLSFLINNIDSDSWILISEVLNVVLYLFQNLKEIYNDIDFSLETFEISYFIKILSLFRHHIPKVRVTAKKIIKYVGEEVIDTDRFINTLGNIVSDALYDDIKKLFKLKHLPKEVPNYVDHFGDQMNVASSYMINKLKEDIDLKYFNKEDNEEFGLDDDNFNIYKNIDNYSKPSNLKNKDYQNNQQSQSNSDNQSNNLSNLNHLKKQTRFDKDKIEISEDNFISNTNTNIDSRNNIKNTINKIINRNNNHIQKLREGKLIENYKNYNNNNNNNQKSTSLKKMQKSLIKTKHRKYNDPNDEEFESKYDKKYDYGHKDKETLSPLKHPDSIYKNIYPGLKSNLDWEKQFKSLDNLRKILLYNSEILYKDTYYFSIIFDQIIQITSTIRPHLAKNALLTLSEIFEIKEINIEQKLDVVVKCLVKKIIEKNTFIGKESRDTLFKFIACSNYEKIIDFLISTYGKNHSSEYYKLIVECLEKTVEYFEEEFISCTVFHKGMNFISNLFMRDKKIRSNIKDFLRSVSVVYKGDESRMEGLLKRYFSNDSLKFIMHMVYEE